MPNHRNSQLINTSIWSTRYILCSSPNLCTILPKITEKSDTEVAKATFSTQSMPNSLQASTSEFSYSTVCCCVCYTRLLISIMIFFWKDAMSEFLKNHRVDILPMKRSKRQVLLLYFVYTSDQNQLTGLLIFRGKKSKIAQDFQGQICGKIGWFRGIFAGKKSKFAENRPISRDFRGRKVKIRQKKSADFADFSGKNSNFEGFSGANY